MYTDKYSTETFDGPSLATCRARARAAMDGRCHCGRHKDPGEVRSIGSRSWLPCQRCLGSIKQLT